MAYTLIIAEKPSAARKIADALADKVPKKDMYMKKIPYFSFTHKGEKVVVVCAVGHLYSLAEKDKKKGWTYPVFNVEWKPTFEVQKKATFSNNT